MFGVIKNEQKRNREKRNEEKKKAKENAKPGDEAIFCKCDVYSSYCICIVKSLLCKYDDSGNTLTHAFEETQTIKRTVHIPL